VQQQLWQAATRVLPLWLEGVAQPEQSSSTSKYLQSFQGKCSMLAALRTLILGQLQDLTYAASVYKHKG